jgi:predicted metalloprotease with PDZ domain
MMSVPRVAVLAMVAGSWSASLAAQGLDPHQASQAIDEVHYTVTFDRATAARDVIHVAMRFTVQSEEPVVLSLPAWTPGSYELDHFARYVSGFRASSSGQPLKIDKLDFDTWRLMPGLDTDVTVEFDFGSDTLDTGMSYMARDFAFFNGTNLFLYAQGQPLDAPATVTIVTEPEWRVATGLRSSGDLTYTATDYHELVDMPTFVGAFDLDSAQVGDIWFRMATYPAGAVAGATRAEMWDQVQRMMPPMTAVFGETPWADYTILLAFDDDFPGGSALEHSNSHLGIFHTQFIGSPVLASVVAHEIFHAWNVKRLRPVELYPYVYDRPQPTDLLWVSEGITDYYADLALVRGGIIDAQGFYQTTAGKVNTVESTPPVSLEDASVSTWTEPTDGTAFIYYPKGSLVGLLLDILIRDATDNAQSLDDVMVDIYRRTYKNGRGFSYIDFWQAVGRATNNRSFADFYSMYVDGTEAYPWDVVLPLAGLQLDADTVRMARIGVQTGQEDSTGARIIAVTPESAAADAGVEADDVLVKVGDVQIRDRSFGAEFRRRYSDDAEGAPLTFVVRRGEETLSLEGELRFAERVGYEIVEIPGAGSKAVAIRKGIMEERN